MSSQLHQWLQQERTAGEHDSEGSFTLERRKAWEKLGAFQLPFAEAWCLKLVQAAYVYPEASLAVTQTKEESAFLFHGVPRLSWPELEAAIFSIDEQDDPFLQHLVIAVRALALQKTRPFSFSCADDKMVVWDGKDFKEIEGAEAGENFRIAVSNYEFGQSKSFLSLSRSDVARYRATILRVLAQRCHLADSGLTVDSRPLSGFEKDPFFGVTDSSYPLAALRADRVHDWEPLVVDVKLVRPDLKIGPFRLDFTAPSDIGNSAFSTAALLSIQYRFEVITESMKLERTVFEPARIGSQIVWVRDGVVVGRESLDIEGPVGLGLVVSANDLSTDLTGMTPLENDAKQERVKRSIEKALPLVEDWVETVAGQGVKVSGFDARTGISGVVGGALMFAVPVVGAVLLGRAGYDYYRFEQLKKHFSTTYNAGLTHLRTELQIRLQK